MAQVKTMRIKPFVLYEDNNNCQCGLFLMLKVVVCLFSFTILEHKKHTKWSFRFMKTTDPNNKNTKKAKSYLNKFDSYSKHELLRRWSTTIAGESRADGRGFCNIKPTINCLSYVFVSRIRHEVTRKRIKNDVYSLTNIVNAGVTY